MTIARLMRPEEMLYHAPRPLNWLRRAPGIFAIVLCLVMAGGLFAVPAFYA